MGIALYASVFFHVSEIQLMIGAPVGRRGQSRVPLEAGRKVQGILVPGVMRDLVDGQIAVPEHLFGLLHAGINDVLAGRAAHLPGEEIGEIGNRYAELPADTAHFQVGIAVGGFDRIDKEADKICPVYGQNAGIGRAVQSGQG